ncbi:MAG TPA: TraR/DksA family transcriptional regulator [Gammaproteobacteria bacterium]|nr:TraR/DksA family transcriptional regulator [Gammaproteobacteria bacterium]
MPSPLTRRQIAELGGRLKMRRTVLLEQVREALLVANRERYGGLARDVHDSGDEVTASLLFDINSIVSDREVHELRDVEATLQRIKAGVFGMCIDCGDDIGSSVSTPTRPRSDATCVSVATKRLTPRMSES